MKKYRGILFDLGGTLFEHQSTESALANLQHAAQQIGIDAPPHVLQERLRLAREAVEQVFAERAFFMHRELVSQSIEQFARSFGYTASAAWVADYCDRQRDSVVADLRLRADAISTLEVLRDHADYLAIVSNIDDDYLEPILARTRLDTYFDHCTSSEAARSCKPDAAFFHHALAFADLSPSEVLFVGDSLLHDVVGARNAGMDVAWLDEAGLQPHVYMQKAMPQPTYRITCLSELLQVAGIQDR